MNYRLYRGYILGLGKKLTTYGMNEVNIFLSKEDVATNRVWSAAGDEFKAMHWLDGEPASVTATQADVDELNSATDWVYAKIGATEMRGRRVSGGIDIEQVSPSYDQGDMGEAVKIIEGKLGTTYGIPTPKYPNYIMEKVRQRLGLEAYDTSRDEEINNMSHNAVLDACLEWEGIIGYGYTVRDWVKGIYGVTLE